MEDPDKSTEEAEDLRAELERLDELQRRVRVKELELDSKRELVDRGWKAFTEEILPKLNQRLAASGLEGLFDVHALLVELNRFLAARAEEAAEPQRALEKALAADEKARLQKEVSRLQAARRRLLREPSPPFVNAGEAKIERLESLLEDAARRGSELQGDLEGFKEALKRAAESATKAAARQEKAELEKEGAEAKLERAAKLAEEKAAEVTRLQTAFGAAAQARAALEGELRRANSERDRVESERSLSNLERERIEADRDEAGRLAAARVGELARLERQIRAAIREKAAAESDVARQKLERDRLLRSMDELRVSLEARAGDIAALSAEFQSLFKEKTALHQVKLRLEAELRLAADERDRLKAQLRIGAASASLAGAEADELRLELRKSGAEADELKLELLKSDAERKDLMWRLTESAAASQRLTDELQRARREAADRGHRVLELEKAAKSLAEKKEELGARISKTESEKLETASRLAKVERERERLAGELTLARADLTASKERAGKLAGELAQAEEPNRRPPAGEAEAPKPAGGGVEVSKAFEAVFPQLSAVASQLLRLAKIPAGAAPAALGALASRVSKVNDELRSAFELIAPAPSVVEGAANPIVEAAIRPWEATLRRRGITLVRRLDAQAPKARLHPERLRVAVFQLIVNAYDAMPRGGAFTITLDYEREASVLKLVFTDTGPGFSEAVLKEPFKPFAHARKGRLGIGLALVNRIVTSFGGKVEAANGLRGARVTLLLPAVSSAQAAGSPPRVP